MMKKAPSSNDKEKDNKAKRKTSRAPHAGNFGFKLKKKINGKDHTAEIPEGDLVQMQQCEDCKQCFEKTQGLSGYRFDCWAVKAAAATRERKQPSVRSIAKDFTNAAMDKKSKHVPHKPTYFGHRCDNDKLC